MVRALPADGDEQRASTLCALLLVVVVFIICACGGV
jgi:hypothetical protein